MPGSAVLPGRLALAAFFATLVLIPIRLRIDLLPRPQLPVQADYTDFLLYAADIALLATLALWGLSLLAAPRRIRPGPRYIWLPLAALSLAGLASTLTSADRALTLYHSLRLAALFLFYLYVVNEIAAPALVLYAVASQGLVQALVAIAQFLTQRSLGLKALGESTLNPAWAGVGIVSTGTDRILRAYGLSDHPNILGGCLAFGLVLLVAAWLWSGPGRRWRLLIAILPMSLALLLTFSRAAWLAWLAGAALLIGSQWALRGAASLKPLLWLALAVALTLAPFAWQQRLLLGIRLHAGGAFAAVGVEQQSAGERVLLARTAAPLLLAHPLTGVGLGASPLALKEASPGFKTPYQPPHLALLDAALETGLLGGASYLLLLLLPWAALLPRRAELAQPQLAGAAALLLAVTVVGFFDYYTWLLVPGRLWQWLSWGLAAAALQPQS